MVICLERGADLHMAQLMLLPLTVSRFSKIQIGFTSLVRAHPGSPGKRAVKRVCVCVCHSLDNNFYVLKSLSIRYEWEKFFKTFFSYFCFECTEQLFQQTTISITEVGGQSSRQQAARGTADCYTLLPVA